MKKLLEELNEKAPIIKITDQLLRGYRAGLYVLSTAVSEDFIDIPRLPKDRFSQTGLFYNIPILDDETLWHYGNKVTLLVVYEVVENKSSMCPLRIDFKWELAENETSVNYWLLVYDQSGQRTIPWDLMVSANGSGHTEILNRDTIKLSELIGYKQPEREGGDGT